MDSEAYYVSSDGVVVTHQQGAAYDILTDAGYSPEKSARIVAACIRDGRNPEEFARHMVMLARAAGGPK